MEDSMFAGRRKLIFELDFWLILRSVPDQPLAVLSVDHSEVPASNVISVICPRARSVTQCSGITPVKSYISLAHDVLRY